MNNLFLITIGVFFLGAIFSLFIQKNNNLANLVGSGFATIGSLLGITFSLISLFNANQVAIKIATSFQFLNISINTDPLSSFFILIISSIALTSSIYGYGYMKKFVKSYNLGYFGFFYNLFIASLILVVTSTNTLYFLIVWELMSITSYFLVIFENKIKENVQAGLLYLIMTHIGTAFILISFLLLYTSTGSFDFSIIQSQANSIPLIVKNAVFLLALIGFGTKAGIIPLHIWLPRAHPAAPSQVSALMSGVMIKTAIFMLIRLFMDIIPSTQLWWGLLILFAGAISSLLGVLYALSEHDIKKLLAYHSVENIGIILMGLGSAMTFYSLNMMPFAMLSLIAALYHTLNHAVFKSLLFMGAGSVVYQTHTHNMEEYGGLIKVMPYTALFFLIGAMAISALPPFNGFASEWLTYQSMFTGIIAQSIAVKTIFIFGVASLAFTGGLAAACFVKAFALTFLAKPRSEEAEKAKESSIFMTLPMAILAISCLILGVLASSVTAGITVIAKSLSTLKNSSSVISTQSSGLLKIGNNFGSLNLPAVFISLLTIFALVSFLVYLKTRHQKEEIIDTWDCGAPPLTIRSEITSTAFARSLITMFGGILKPTKQHEIEYSDVNTRYFTSSRTVTLEVPNLHEKYLYRPVHNIFSYISDKISYIQNGNVNQYLLYILITLIALLVWSSF